MTLEKRFWHWDLLILALLAAGLRFHHLDGLGFYYDEAENALVARVYLETGRFDLPSGRPEPNGLTYKWITAQLFKAFGESEWLARVPSAVCGVLTTILIYLWGSHWFGSWTGRWAALLYAVWPWSVTWGRTGRFYSLQQLLYVLLVIAVWKALERNRLGAPIAEPPRTRGPRPSMYGELAGLAPCMVLFVLSILTSFISVASFAFVPLYLLMRLVWSWRRGGTEDAEFDRTKNYLYILLGGLVVAVGTLYLIGPRVVQLARDAQTWEISPGYYPSYLRDNFGFLFLLGCAAGLVAALGRGLPGWLVFASVAGPLIVNTFFPPFYRPRFVYNLFPFLCLSAGLVLGWASMKMESFVSAFSVRPKLPRIGELVGGIVIACGLLSLVANVLLAERSTAAIVAGSPYTLAREVADFRGMAEWAKGFTAEAAIVSTDPVLSDYYLGRTDYIYPTIRDARFGTHPHSKAENLPDAESLLQVLESHPQTVILGTRRKFEGTIATDEKGKKLWETIKAGSAETWEGELEMGLLWVSSH